MSEHNKILSFVFVLIIDLTLSVETKFRAKQTEYLFTSDTFRLVLLFLLFHLDKCIYVDLFTWYYLNKYINIVLSYLRLTVHYLYTFISFINLVIGIQE